MPQDLTKTNAFSKIHGLQYVDKFEDEFTISGFSLGAGATTTRQNSLPIGISKAMTNTRLKFIGVSNNDVNNKSIWAPGVVRFRASDYDVEALARRQLNSVVLVVGYQNPTGSSVNIPTHTIAITTYVYTAPW